MQQALIRIAAIREEISLISTLERFLINTTCNLTVVSMPAFRKIGLLFESRPGGLNEERWRGPPYSTSAYPVRRNTKIQKKK
jgi:hypothetical protein